MTNQYKREPLTQEEADRIANACQTHQEKIVVWTLLDMGLRCGELAGLRKDDIEWQRHRVRIHGKGGPFGKKSKLRVLPFTSRIQPLIEGHFAIHNTFGITKRTIERIVKRIAERADISRPVVPHVLRHTFSVTSVQKGISIPSLQYLLGHDHLSTTQIYTRISPEEVIREFQGKW